MSKNPSNEMLLKDGKFNIELMISELPNLQSEYEKDLEFGEESYIKTAFRAILEQRNICFDNANKFDNQILKVYKQLQDEKIDINDKFKMVNKLSRQIYNEIELIYYNQPQEIKDLFVKTSYLISDFGMPDKLKSSSDNRDFRVEYYSHIVKKFFPEHAEQIKSIREDLHTTHVKDKKLLIDKLNALYESVKKRQQILDGQPQEVRSAINSLFDFVIKVYDKKEEITKIQLNMSLEDDYMSGFQEISRVLVRPINREIVNPTFEVIAKALDKLSTAPVKNAKQMADKIQKFQLSKEQEFEEIIQSNETLLKP